MIIISTDLAVVLVCGSISFLSLTFSDLTLICVFRWIKDIYREFQENSTLQNGGHPNVQHRGERDQDARAFAISRE